MNIPGIILILIGIVFLIYSIISRNEININKIDKFNIKDIDKLLNLQFTANIINSLIMICLGFIIVIYNFSNLYVIFYAFIFVLINYIITPIAVKKGYIEVK